MPISRPKVHRLPVSPVRPQHRFSPTGIGLFAAVALALGVGHWFSLHAPQASLPELAPVAEMSAPSQTAGTIIIKDDNQVIVGQMARIPAQNQQITGVQSTSGVDKGSGPELLSIVSKH